jgi:cell wall-associated NlpC family hydrolase
MEAACPECWLLRGEQPDTAARLAWIRTARTMIKWPFMAKGRGPTGIDCSGLLYVSACKAGLPAVDLDAYPTDFHGYPFVAAFAERMNRVHRINDALPGDVMLIGKTIDTVQHAGLFTDHGTFIHASFTKGQVAETVYDAYYRELTFYVFRMKNFG